MNRTTLAAWRAGALEPPELLAFEEAVSEAELAEGLALDLSVPKRADPWRIPPRWGLQAQILRADVLRGSMRAGDRFRVVLEDAPEDARVVVLRRNPSWQVVFDGELYVRDLPVEDGKHVLDLSAGAESGTQHWAVATPRVLEGLQEAMARGEVPVARVSVVVG